MNLKPVLLMLGVIVMAILLLLFLGPFLLMFALNYVFYLLYSWKLLGTPITITFWESFWLVIAAIIIRIMLFGQHLDFMQRAYIMRQRPTAPPKQKQAKSEPPSTSYR
ncbi:MAG: hypothetical protein M1354_02045 [Candidatus Marsarchaeota archaeon]|jgi:hypothetical protein|nr:hypothetical protein [Candidatus Marsarchaeota archaeon]